MIGPGRGVCLLALALTLAPICAGREARATPDPQALPLPAATAYGPRVPRRLLCDPAVWPRAVDGALCDAAWLLAHLAVRIDLQDDTARQDLLARWAPFLCLRQGVPDSRVRATLVRDARYGVVHAKLEAKARALPPGQRIGVGIAPFPSGAVGILLSIESTVLPAPFVRRPKQGRAMVVRGTLSRGTKATRALLERPSGETLDLDFELSHDTVSLTLPRLDARGVYRLQLLIDRGRGPEIGLFAPLYVDVAEPTEPPKPRFGSTTSGEAAPAAQEGSTRPNAVPLTDRAHALLATYRSQETRLPLRRAPALDRIALARASTMALEREVVHEPRHGKDARQLLSEARFRHRFLAEDLALGPTLASAFESLTRSPAHRSALLESRANAVGIGVVKSEDGVYLAVLLAGVGRRRLASPLAREIDRQRALLELFEKIQRRRRAARVPVLMRDPDLDPVAQHLADKLAASGKRSDPGAMATVQTLLATRDPPARGAFLDVVVAPEVRDAAAAPAATDPGCLLLGLGASEGEQEGLEQAFVVILCLPRAP